MAIERERRFIVDAKKLPPLPPGRLIRTGYFTRDGVAIRVSISSAGAHKVCFKSPGTIERLEFEYSIPRIDAEALLEMAPTILEKTRYDLDGWEIDEFHIADKFWLAEWEDQAGKPELDEANLPEWIGREVTHLRYATNQSVAFSYGRK